MDISINDTRLYFDTDGAQLRLTPDGLASAPTLVVLHGGPGFDQAYLRRDLGRLRDLTQLVFLDLRGQGRSVRVPVETCTLEQMADDVVAFCISTGLENPVLFGHSAGGFVALHAALRAPSRFAGLVLCNTAATLAPEPDPGAPTLGERADPAVGVLAGRIFSGDLTPDLEEAFYTDLAPFYAGPGHPEVPGPLFRLSPPRPDLIQWFFGYGQQAARYDLRDRLREITAPVLVLAGGYDWVCPPQAARAIAAGLPDAELVVLDRVGHLPFAEEPDQFDATIKRFLGRMPVGSFRPVGALGQAQTAKAAAKRADGHLTAAGA